MKLNKLQKQSADANQANGMQFNLGNMKINFTSTINYDLLREKE